MTSLKPVETINDTGDQEKAVKNGRLDRFDFYKYDKRCWISRENLQERRADKRHSMLRIDIPLFPMNYSLYENLAD